MNNERMKPFDESNYNADGSEASNMVAAEDIKNLVRQKYGEIAQSECSGGGSCCGVVESASADFTIFADDYSALQGYAPEADLRLGCGLPTEFAKLSPGDVVVDLGSGAGNDAFVARALVGEKGRVIGIDMTEPMIAKARRNAEKLNFTNVEFRYGEIESIPLDSESVDVVISNCVLNLVPDKSKAFSEIFRILKPGGHFSISDVVLESPLPSGLQKAAEMYAGCVAGAILKGEYLRLISLQGFKGVHVQKEKSIEIPHDVLAKHLLPEEVSAFLAGDHVIRSVTVYGEKPCGE